MPVKQILSHAGVNSLPELSHFEINDLGQPVGLVVADWTPPLAPTHQILLGRYCRLEAVSAAKHTEALFAAMQQDQDQRNWTYLNDAPFSSLADCQTRLAQYQSSSDPLFYSIVDVSTQQAVGLASYLRITPSAGSIEVGHLNFSPRLQRTPAATEAMYLMMQHAFELGYRRYEWKCNALNQPSRQAALRLGFTFEGVFRQAMISRGRNRDTAWFSILNHEWPTLRQAFECWLAPENFDAQGQQRVSLASLRSTL